MGNKERMIWNLAWRCHLSHGQDFWAEHGVNIFTQFVKLAEQWFPERGARRSGAPIMANPQAWEMECEAYVTNLLRSSVPSITAQ
jgi:hypothetical protein